MNPSPELSYPDAERLDLVEDVCGTKVADPYRWLEDAASEQTTTWSRAQDELFATYRDRWPGRSRLRERLTALMASGVVGSPAWRGQRRFFMRRTAEQEHAVLLTVEPDGTERVLVDPVSVDPSGTTTLDSWQPSKEGELLAYQLSTGGDEEARVYVIDVRTGRQVDGPIDRTRYSPVAWLPGGKAFYYARRLPADQVPDGEQQYHRRVWLHQLGSDPDSDVLVFGDGLEKTNYYGMSVSMDGRWLVVTAAAGTAPRNDAWIADIGGTAASSPQRPAFVDISTGVDARTAPHVGRDGRLYVFTDLDEPRGRLAVTSPERPGVEHWVDLVRAGASGAGSGAVLEDYAVLDEGLDRPVLLAGWTRHTVAEVSVHDLASGERIGEVQLPGLGSIGGLSERPEGGHEVWFGYTDHVTPPSVYRFDAVTGQTTLWASPPGSVDVPAVQAQQVTYTSRDGTEVRMFVLSGRPPASADTAATAQRPAPTVLYGYGGFGLPLTPAYSASILAWVEAGGVYAVANLRGGSEEGEEWHRAGMRAHKQNVFDDFHAAADWLVEHGWTTPQQLGISGGSNGGLLVGAALTQRPHAYAAVVCAAPLLDMVRYEQFGLGQTWNDEFGRADDPTELGWLLGYSPYHHVREDRGYPAVLFTVFDSDTRVDPMHARKMCAALQAATSSSRPVLYRRETDVGHGARALSRTVGLSVDSLAFLAEATGLDLT